MRRQWVAGLVLVGISSVMQTGFAAEPKWQRIKVDEAFRSEGVAAADVNRDGKMDVINGSAWYEAPNWTMHPLREVKDYKDGAAGYSNSFANWAYDLNGDGWSDLICIDFPGTPCYWFENPKGKEGDWPKHEIWHSAANESPQFKDVTGDGKPELIFGSEPEKIVGYLEIPAGDKVKEKWTFTEISPKGFPHSTPRYYHGLGTGDVNGDGRMDVIIPHGWFEHPGNEKLGSGPWAFHEAHLTKDGKPGFLPASDIHVDDLDLDGDSDIMMSSAHQIGIWWFENVGSKSEPKFEYHLISEEVTQTHALHYVDINGDGTKDLVTGKRWWAHGPKGDANPNDTPVVIWFEIQRTKSQPPKFTSHVIAESAGTGIGTQFQVTDFNGDNALDIILSNKKGTNVLLQQQVTAAR